MNLRNMREEILMKKFAFVVLFFASAAAYADSCSVAMTSVRGSILDTFTGFGYSRSEACKDALRECEYDRQRRDHDRIYRDAACTVLNDRRPTPTPDPRREQSCTFDLKRANGIIIESFDAFARNEGKACRQAQRQCEDELRHRHSQGRNPRAFCEKSYRSGRHDRPRFETKTCSVDRVTVRGQGRGRGRGDRGQLVLETHFATATGRIGTDVQRDACDQAMRMCESQARYSRFQFCITRDSGRRHFNVDEIISVDRYTTIF
jgi:hypothetical protein